MCSCKGGSRKTSKMLGIIHFEVVLARPDVSVHIAQCNISSQFVSVIIRPCPYVLPQPSVFCMMP
uniref:Uncharacterized protein n=1 Tax=Triticum urartu TaxID=4572 RepID=A0A8R7JZI3_TRIUA